MSPLFVGAPLVLTQPHCYNCHPDYLNMVNGYNPSVDRHGLYTTFEPVIGIHFCMGDFLYYYFLDLHKYNFYLTLDNG